MKNYNPDVLNCLANLSNDEVFTPPVLANQVLDMLPQELFCSPDTKFLDPVSKSGVFLREIVKRLDRGLQLIIPDRQQRIDHIMHHQVFGIATTELTSYISRRSLYCSREADSQYSVSHFDNAEGNIVYRNLRHTWQKGKCKYCGASKDVYDRSTADEHYAYQFIHTDNPQKLFPNMKFDVIIGNPPYQLGVGNEGGNSSKAKSIYHEFIDRAMKLSPRYLTMIVPSRWMTRSTEGIPEEWIDRMLSSKHFVEIHDFEKSSDCFPGVSIMGGVNYFLWSKDYNGKCKYFYNDGNTIQETIRFLDPCNAGIVIRDSVSYSIIQKLESKEGAYYLNPYKNFSDLVSPKDFFTNKTNLTSSWNKYKSEPDNTHSIKYFVNPTIHRRNFGWVSRDQIPKNTNSIKLTKILIASANGAALNNGQIIGAPIYAGKNCVCSQTYLVIAHDEKRHIFSEEECYNIISYIKTKFFRFLVNIKKKTQNGPRAVYQFVPLQDFSHPWTDEMLYKKYGLTDEEIAFIESMIRPME